MIEQFTQPSTRLYSVADASDAFEKFKVLCQNKCTQEDCPNAVSIEKNIPVYDLSSISPLDTPLTTTLQDEWYNILHTGAGVFVLQNFYPDTTSIDKINETFDSIIAAEAEAAANSSTTKKGDHFAASGKNARIWNSFQKHAEASPETFVPYYSNTWLSLVCSSWLGPGHQITAQVNIVRPGGSPQVCHRDYHLGFQTAETCSRIPRGMQLASQFLTLQGAVAHSDMPLSSGPTRFLPFSQCHEEGYMAYRLPEYQEHFDSHWVSLPLSKGDAVFFNPALFHAAGENSTQDINRIANLLQISSPFGKAMETIDTRKIIDACWPVIVAKYKKEGLSVDVESVVAAVASGYPFPTNLDRRPPAPGGMAPESEAGVCLRGLTEGWDKSALLEALDALRENSLA